MIMVSVILKLKKTKCENKYPKSNGGLLKRYAFWKTNSGPIGKLF